MNRGEHDAQSDRPQGAVAFAEAYRITFMAAADAFLLAALLPGRMTADPNAAPIAH